MLDKFIKLDRKIRRYLSKKNKDIVELLNSDKMVKAFGDSLSRDPKNHIDGGIEVDLSSLYNKKCNEFFYFYIVISDGEGKKFGQAQDCENRFKSYASKTDKISENDVKNQRSMVITFKVPTKLLAMKTKSEFNSDTKYDQVNLIPFILKDNTPADYSRGKYRSHSFSVEAITNITCYQIILSVLKYFTTINNSLDKVKRIYDWNLYEYQKNASDFIKEKFFVQKVMNLISPTRSGKSVMIIDIIKKLAYDKNSYTAFIITSYPSGFESFRKVCNLHKDYEGFQIVKYKNGAFGIFNLEIKVKVYFVSWQALKNEKANAIDIINDLNPNIIVIDEFHRESDTDKSKELIDFIKSGKTKILNVSATPYEEYLSGEINKYNSYIITRKDIRGYRKKNNLPDYRQTGIMLDATILNNLYKEALKKGWDPDEALTFTKLFETVEDTKTVTTMEDVKNKDNVKFKYELAIVQFMILLFCRGRIGMSKKYGLAGNEKLIKEVFLNNLVLVPSQLSAYCLNALFHKHQDLKNLGYSTICDVSNSELKSKLKDINGNKLYLTREERDSDELTLDRWMEENNNRNYNISPKPTIIFTAQKNTTAVTLEHLTAVFVLREITSMELFIQVITRPNNTSKEKLRNTAFVCPKGIFLKSVVQIYIIESTLNVKKDLASSVKEFYDNMENLFILGDNSFKLYPADIIMEDIENDLQKNALKDDPKIQPYELLYKSFSEDEICKILENISEKSQKELLNNKFEYNTNYENNGKTMKLDKKQKQDNYPSNKYIDKFKLFIGWYKEIFCDNLISVIKFSETQIFFLDDVLKIPPYDWEMLSGITKKIIIQVINNFPKESVSIWNRYLRKNSII